jgi:hypothetical protein
MAVVTASNDSSKVRRDIIPIGEAVWSLFLARLRRCRAAMMNAREERRKAAGRSEDQKPPRSLTGRIKVHTSLKEIYMIEATSIFDTLNFFEWEKGILQSSFLLVSNDLWSRACLSETINTSVDCIWLQLLDSQESIVLGDSLSSARCTSLDDTSSQSDSQVRNGDICYDRLSVSPGQLLARSENLLTLGLS